MTTSWKEIYHSRLRGQGIDPVEASFESRFRKEGCMIRALESITGQLATKDEIKFRLAQIDALPEVLDYLCSGGKVETLFAMERQNLGRVIVHSRKQRTQLGNELNKRQITSARLTPEEMKENIIVDGRGVLFDHFLHVAHVDIGNNGKLVFVSDDNVEAPFKDSIKYRCLVFDKK